MLQEQLNQTFFQEYLDRTFFVILHAGLVLLYLFLLGGALARLRRERRTLRQLGEDWDAERPDEVGQEEGGRRLADLRQALEQAPKTAFTRQLRAIVGTTAAGEDFDTQRVTSNLARSLTSADDLIRFCINGLVIVGLMGTLYAFYQMWGTHGTASLTADNSSVYLESLSTALVVSFVGLLLALVTNFFFALLRSRRQALLEEVSAFLVPVAGLLPTDAKTHLLLTSLLSPLERLVAQLTRQNDEVLRGLTEAVHARTEQLNLIISETAGEWQKSVTAFRSETLTSVGDLRQATGRLADSSHVVAGTMSEVSRALERTKDIGRIVDRLEATSGELIKMIGHRLEAAATDWAATYVRAAQSYEATLQRQSAAVGEASREMAAAVRGDLEALVKEGLAELGELKRQLAGTLDDADKRLASTLEGFGAKFAESLETLSARWMTRADGANDATTASLSRIVNEWQTAVATTAGTVRTALDGSRDLASEMKESVVALGNDLVMLQGLARAASETAGAPVYLGRAVEQLGQIADSLAALAAKMEYGQSLRQIEQSVTAGRAEVHSLGGSVKEIGAATLEESRAVSYRLRGVDAQFGELGREMSALRSELQRLPDRLKPRPRPPAPPPPPEPESIWRRLFGGLGKGTRRARVEGETKGESAAGEDYLPVDGDAPDEPGRG